MHEVFDGVDFDVIKSNDPYTFKSVVRDEGNILGSCKELRVISTLFKASANDGAFEFENDNTTVFTCHNPITFGGGITSSKAPLDEE